MSSGPDIRDIRVGGITRGAFLARSVLGAGALYGAVAAGPTLAGVLAHAKHGAFTGGDVGILNFALTLEKVEADFYKRALAVKELSADAKKLIESISQNEAAHVQALTLSLTQLGAKADPAPQTSFPPLTREGEVLQLAVQLEDTGVWAYNGAASQVQSKDVLQAVASIAQVEARHAGALRELAGMPPSDAAFDKVFSGTEADEAVHALTSAGAS